MSRQSDLITSARLACGCTLGFRTGEPGSPVTIVVTAKSVNCAISLHVSGLPVYDLRDALRPATRPLLPLHTDHEEEN